MLGPPLFSIYIIDIVNACNLSYPCLFADDALLFDNIYREKYLSIRIETLTIIQWLSVNKVSLNVDKTNLLILDNSVKIKLSNNHAIKECKSFKYLGLMVNNNLKFDIHVDYIKKKIQKRIGAMYIICIREVVYCQLNVEKCLLTH